MAHLTMPRTNTPKEVYGGLLLLAVLTVAILLWLLGFWGVIIALAIFILAINSYTEEVPAFHAQIILNAWTKKQRVLFQGLNFVLPWESRSMEKIDLRVELHDVPEETYPSEDAMMDVRYVYTIRPNFSGDNPGTNIILYATYEPNAIKMEGRALFSMLLSDHYRVRPSDQLRNKNEINKLVFAEGHGKDAIAEFEQEHGVDVMVKLEDSDFNAETQKARDIIAKAKSIGEAKTKLVEAGYSHEEAEKVVKMLNLPDSVRENIINVQAEVRGLEKLERFSTIIGGLGGDDHSSSKKGGKK
ncbi:hypothetical protein HZA26_03850 [Candidatus Nomurabacteria bacterium]|nr:hypothetical protein [Candidatus Nomurabacteria bacterium]